MATEWLDFYTAHDALTDPSANAARLDELPADMDALHAALNGVLLHQWKARAHHPHVLAPPAREVFVRHTARLLEAVLRLDAAPLAVPRPVERRAVVDCRHFAVLLCAVLRHRGVPARPRCGFAAHAGQPLLVDHWVCEVWDAAQRRWVLEDADLQLHDLAADAFVTGARAWRRYRADPATADRCGDGPAARGPRLVRRNLVRDIAALNGFPSVSGDAWGLGRAGDDDVTAADAVLLDRVAALAEAADDAAPATATHTADGASRTLQRGGGSQRPVRSWSLHGEPSAQAPNLRFHHGRSGARANPASDRGARSLREPGWARAGSGNVRNVSTP
jgi:hypothetical protein